MKNFIKICFFVFGVFVMSACSNESSGTQESNTKVKNNKEELNLEQLVNEYNNSHRNIPAVFHTGNLDFGISEDALVVLVGNENDYKKSYRIQMNTISLENFSTLKGGKFDLGYFGADLIIRNGDKSIYFAIDGETKYNKIAEAGDVYKVVGIGQNKMNFDENLSKSQVLKLVDESASCTCKPVLEPTEDCKSGGSGSTSCSQGDCSVTCGSGNYACCNE